MARRGEALLSLCNAKRRDTYDVIEIATLTRMPLVSTRIAEQGGKHYPEVTSQTVLVQSIRDLGQDLFVGASTSWAPQRRASISDAVKDDFVLEDFATRFRCHSAAECAANWQTDIAVVQ